METPTPCQDYRPSRPVESHDRGALMILVYPACVCGLPYVAHVASQE